jgi:hypothetical protein
MMAGSQKPPKQKPEQHWAAVVHPPLTGTQLVGGGTQTPAAHVLLQHAAFPVHAAPVAAHGVLQTRVAGSHTPRQHWASLVHAAVSARQVSTPNPQRGGFIVSSQTSEQQPRPEPDVHVSPVGRQFRLGRSIWHSPPWQMFEQHSALAAQLSLSILHSPPPQRPPKQPSVQQSSAWLHATPSAKQALVHCLTPACPVTGSQRPLQHCAWSVQSTAGPWHVPFVGLPPLAPPCPRAPPRPAPPSAPARPVMSVPHETAAKTIAAKATA